jgi:hypothetical protein
MKDVKWLKVWECQNPEQAHVLRAFLESRGIRVILQGIEEESLFPGLEFSKIPVLVLEDDEIKARKLIDEFFTKPGKA